VCVCGVCVCGVCVWCVCVLCVCVCVLSTKTADCIGLMQSTLTKMYIFSAQLIVSARYITNSHYP